MSRTSNFDPSNPLEPTAAEGLRSVRLGLGLLLILIAGLACPAPAVEWTNVVTDAEVRNCSPDIFKHAGALDVVVAIDTSLSTRRPTGFDIDGDEAVHRFARNNAIDRGDSRLAAQIAALRTLIREAEGTDIRFSIVTFSGPTTAKTTGLSHLSGSHRDSRIQANLTGDTARLDTVLSDVFDAGSNGKTVFSSGMQRATLSFTRRQALDRRRVALLLTDSPGTILLDTDGNIERLDPRMKSAAVIAIRNGITFHTFGLSQESEEWRDKAIGQIAGATGGSYHPVADPKYYYCHLAHSLLPADNWRRAFARYRNAQESDRDPTESSKRQDPRQP